MCPVELVGKWLERRHFPQVEETDELVFVLIDEVESLTSARKSAVSGSEPSDAIRAVNSLLTHLDSLKNHANVMVLCTSNLPEAVDVAFVDRADIKVRTIASFLAEISHKYLVTPKISCFHYLKKSFLDESIQRTFNYVQNRSTGTYYPVICASVLKTK